MLALHRQRPPAVDHAVRRGPVECVEVDRLAGLSALLAAAARSRARAGETEARPVDDGVAVLVGHPVGEPRGLSLVVEAGDPAFEPVVLAELQLARDRRALPELERSPDRMPVAVSVQAQPGAGRAGIVVLVRTGGR